MCAETCVGRLRYIGPVLYDADRVLEAASTAKETDLYEAQLGMILDPNDPEVVAGATSGISDEYMDAARRSPVSALAKTYRIAVPLHPEYRTMPMVWYVPPLSPVVDAISRDGHDGEDPENLLGAIDALPIPVEYLAGLFSAGDTAVVTGVLKKLAAMRAYMRDINLGREPRARVSFARLRPAPRTQSPGVIEDCLSVPPADRGEQDNLRAHFRQADQLRCVGIG